MICRRNGCQAFLEPGMWIGLGDVSKMSGRNPRGDMDHWSFQVVQVRAVFDNYFNIYGDEHEHNRGLRNPGWHWFPEIITEVYEGNPFGEQEQIEAPDLSILFGGTI